jgi:hypothetical protein
VECRSQQSRALEECHRPGPLPPLDLYFIKRTATYPSFVTFDAADRQLSTPRRIPTNTPLQALVTLNDPVYHQAAQALAARMAKAPQSAGHDAIDSRLDYGARLVLSRDLTAAEAAPCASSINPRARRGGQRAAQPRCGADTVNLMADKTILFTIDLARSSPDTAAFSGLGRRRVGRFFPEFGDGRAGGRKCTAGFHPQSRRRRFRCCRPNSRPRSSASSICIWAARPASWNCSTTSRSWRGFTAMTVPESFIKGKRLASFRAFPKLLGPMFPFHRAGKSGTWISDRLPHLERAIDDLCVIKSMKTDQFNHAPAQLAGAYRRCAHRPCLAGGPG